VSQEQTQRAAPFEASLSQQVDNLKAAATDQIKNASTSITSQI
jgi:hypothetical protein